MIEEEPNSLGEQKQYRIVKEKKKIKKHFAQLNGGLISTFNEEMFKTRTFNNATFYYVDDAEVDNYQKRKLAEEKLIVDYVSERESFIQKQQRGKRPVNDNIKDFVELADITLNVFLKQNKIHPKIFSADTIIQQEKELPGKIKSIKPNSNKKHCAI